MAVTRSMLRWFALGAAAALFAGTAQAQSWSPTKATELDRFIRSALQVADVPGAGVAVVMNGQIVFERAYGVRDRNTGTPVNTATQFAVASISKPITTMMTAAIVDSGRASWNTRAQSIYPAFRVADPTASANITLRNLFCNCTGVARRDGDWIFRSNTLTPSQIIAQNSGAATDPVFGQRFIYSNQMVATGGWLAAAAGAGSTADLRTAYLTQVKSRIFDRVGMHATTANRDDVLARNNFAADHPYNVDNVAVSQGRDAERALMAVMPAGGVWSTAGDMARFVITQLNRGVAPSGVRVVSEANLTETWKPQVTINAEAQLDYGLGLFRQTVNGRRWLFHGGNGLGSSANIVFLPDQGVGVVVLTNRGITPVRDYVAVHAIRQLFDESAADLFAALIGEVSQTSFGLLQLAVQLRPVPAAEAHALAGQWNNALIGPISVNPGALPGFFAPSFTNRLAKYVDTSTTIYIARDEKNFGFYLDVPSGGRVNLQFDNPYVLTR